MPRSRYNPEEGIKTKRRKKHDSKFKRSGVTMFRVLNIRGALTKDKLDPAYVSSAPSFWLTESRRTIKMSDGTTISVNGVYKASVFLKLLKMIAVAGDRLHKINKAKHAAIGVATLLARKSAEANDVPVGVKVFKI